MNDLDIWAFPSHGSMGEVVQEGMTLRDYFAAKAMQTIMSPNPVTGQYPQSNEFEWCAVAAYQMADAMLAARSAT